MKQIIRYLVVPRYTGGWTVRRQHAKRISFWFRTRREAIAYARSRTEVYSVHRRDGSVQWLTDAT